MEFSKLVSIMKFTRMTTLAEVSHFTVEHLNFLFNDEANSIGMLLEHIISIEKAYQIETFEKREFTEEDIRNLNPGLELGKIAQEQIKGHSIDYYLS